MALPQDYYFFSRAYKLLVPQKRTCGWTEVPMIPASKSNIGLEQPLQSAVQIESVQVRSSCPLVVPLANKSIGPVDALRVVEQPI